MGKYRAARGNCLFFIVISFLLHKFNFPLGELDMVIANSNERDIRQVNNPSGVPLTIFAFREQFCHFFSNPFSSSTQAKAF